MNLKPCAVSVTPSFTGDQVPPPPTFCMPLPVVVWPRMVIGGTNGPSKPAVPASCQSSQ
jgi:hypothetical protein